MELAVILAFCLQLIAFVAMGVNVLVPLAVGFALFFAYGLARGHAPSALLRSAAHGAGAALGVLESFVLIGVLTALWRADGTISQIVVMTSSFVGPRTAPLACFLLCALVSYLIGTSFGTAATMGVACGTLSGAMGANALLTGGAVLAGCYFGDRCSPVSSSALLVRTLTGTRMRDNLKGMLRTAAVPFAVSVAFYAALGFALAPAGAGAGTGAGGGVSGLLVSAFGYNLWALVPAALIFILPLTGLGMKRCMGLSCAAAALVCLSRGSGALDLARWAWAGYAASDPSVAALMDGGGILSMVNVSLVVSISSSYAGLFDETGLVDGVRASVEVVARRFGAFAAVLTVSVPASMIACNQTLAIMLSEQLCEKCEPDPGRLAIDLENGPVVISPLIPWSIACSTILTFSGAPANGWIAAVYLWLIPLWHLVSTSRPARENKANGKAKKSAETFFKMTLAKP